MGQSEQQYQAIILHHSQNAKSYKVDMTNTNSTAQYSTDRQKTSTGTHNKVKSRKDRYMDLRLKQPIRDQIPSLVVNNR